MVKKEVFQSPLKVFNTVQGLLSEAEKPLQTKKLTGISKDIAANDVSFFNALSPLLSH